MRADHGQSLAPLVRNFSTPRNWNPPTPARFFEGMAPWPVTFGFRGPAPRGAGRRASSGPAARSTFRGTSRSRAVVIASRTSSSYGWQFPRRAPRRPARRGSGGASGRGGPRSRDPAVDVEHRALDQVGGRPLDHGVDAVRSARLRVRPVVFLIPLIGRRRPRIVSTRPAGQRGLERPGDEGVDAGVFLEVGLDERGGLGLGDPEPGGQAERAQAVDHAEVDRLGHPPLRRVDGRLGDVEDPGGDGGVDVVVLGEGPDQRRVARVVGQDAELDLRVVGRQERPAGRARRRTPGGSGRRPRCGSGCSGGSGRSS